MIIYGLKNCDTCRKALKALPDAVLQDVRAEPLSIDVLQAAFAAHGEALLNTRSTTWRGLDEAERGREPITLLQEHPALMKRPLIAVNGTFFLGWSKDTESAVKAQSQG